MRPNWSEARSDPEPERANETTFGWSTHGEDSEQTLSCKSAVTGLRGPFHVANLPGIIDALACRCIKRAARQLLPGNTLGMRAKSARDSTLMRPRRLKHPVRRAENINCTVVASDGKQRAIRGYLTVVASVSLARRFPWPPRCQHPRPRLLPPPSPPPTLHRVRLVAA